MPQPTVFSSYLWSIGDVQHFLTGNELSNMLEEPVLRNLLGGTQAVILGDKLARSLLVQPEQTSNVKKTMVERKGKPSFDVVVEMTERNRWKIYHDVEKAADNILRGLLPILYSKNVINSLS